jgi:uncharacterized glyoxalase superfamily protein PhnB
MLVYTLTQCNSWDGKEIVSVHLTKKGAMLDAVCNMCSELLDASSCSVDFLNKEEIEHIEKWYSKIDEKGMSIAELQKALDYTSERYWHLEREVFIEEHTIKI